MASRCVAFVRAMLLGLYLVCFLGACATRDNQMIPEDKFSLKEHAVIIGKISHQVKGLFGDSEENVYLDVVNLGENVSFSDNATKDYCERVDLSKNAGVFGLGGNTFAYNVRPGMHVISTNNIVIGDKTYYVATPAKRNALLGVITAAFDSDFYKNPNEYVRSLNPTLVPGILGYIKVKAGDIIYFGDVSVVELPNGFVFVIRNNIDAARKYLQDAGKQFGKDLVFVPWTGPRFIPVPIGTPTKTQ